MPDDYLMSQIEGFAHALARIMGLAKLRQYEAAIEVINQSTSQLLDLDLDAIMSHPSEALVGFLERRYPPYDAEPLRRELVTLLREAGAIDAARENPERARNSWLKALDLLLQPTAGTTAARLELDRPLVDELLSKLDRTDIPNSTGFLKRNYFERIGSYSPTDPPAPVSSTLPHSTRSAPR
jgi:hypothetical protein